ncbi:MULTISPECIES: TetR/AcrR family transcriptional regulator [unclassified Paenibacillus]|uniref:TetR/AcrR family transcriptional regulator n=1 Tax=Paenibacillus provencensis TaxID=441151 RepID=A0ABW3PYM4_9BACL|nr:MULTISPECIES: TetR/AcrR family transcriptional regulator [unclassified Paenibacillus]MCM3130056.1 TetR/AcrR family transcriptional regulator [Paenibacillus sp. MER 78]SFS62025.1 DNA-binding transcriptional regulator, AcrR family [Paenibacillus sp. 453mf]
MEDTNDRRSKRTRLALKVAFIELVLEKGYEATTIMDIASRADYNRGTFYNHYIDKEDLLREIKGEFLQGVSTALLAPYEGMDRVDADKIYPSTLRLLEHIEHHKDQFKALLSVSNDLSYDICNLLKDAMRNDMHIVMNDSSRSIDYEIMLSYRMPAFVGVIMYWAETDFKYSASYMAEQVMIQTNLSLDYIEFKNR